MIDLRWLTRNRILKILVIGSAVLVVTMGFVLILDSLPNTCMIKAMSQTERIKNAAQFITQENIIEGSRFIFK